MTWLWAVAVLTTVLVVACERVPLTAPTASTITVSVDQTTLPINGQATVRAIVIESAGTPVQNGTQVVFSTTLGSFNPRESTTVNGVATTTFMAGVISGATKINAYSGGASTGSGNSSTGSGNSSAGGVEVKIGTAGVDRISVRSEPTNVPVTGGTVVIVATLFDVSGNAIVNTPLSFSTDFGSLSSTTAPTDTRGEARVQLTTNRTTVITVTAGSKSQPFTLNALSPPQVGLSCGTNTATVGVPVNCTITTPSVSGNLSSNAPIQSVTISWGDGSGEQPLGALTGSTVVSHTFGSPGSFVVTAAATDGNSQRGTAVVTLTVTRTLPTLTDLTVPTTGTVGVPVAMSVTPPATPAIPIQSVRIEFGDGTSRDLGAINGKTGFTKTFGSAGGYTVTAIVTDTTGQQGRQSSAIVVSAAAAPTITFTNTTTGGEPLKVGTNETFSVSATAATGAPSVTNLRVTQDGTELYNGSNPGSFAWKPVFNGTATFTIVATDSAGTTTTLVKTMTVDP